MSHLETWPDIFTPMDTYVPFDWEGRNLVEQARAYLKDDASRARIARRAFESYRDQLAAIDARFESVIAEIVGKEL
jgi:hypothetical protein